jgi:hypothetical protein
MVDRPKKSASVAAKKSAEDEADSFVISKYNDVVSNAELVDIKLTSSSFKIEGEYFADMRQDPKLEVSGSPRWTRLDSERGIIAGGLDWSVTCRQGRKVVLSIKASYLVAYGLSEPVEDKYAEYFVQNVGRFAVYPYFRNLVAQYSAASSAELPLLPVLKQRIDRSPN